MRTWRWVIANDRAEELMWVLSPHLGQRRRDRFMEVLLEVREVR